MRLPTMHELSVCQGLLHEVEAVARDHSAARVLSIVLRIGPLSGVEPALLQEAFTLASAGTLVAGAELMIERSAVRVECNECGKQAQARSVNCLTCPSCGSWRTRVLEGEELLLTRVELEREEAALSS
ncbi:MAG TPA: hydrogenase maturation nickel metallochaperone HypA [Steroidobacteraceae bacterium]|nr:hydrogenase maturation nickel metallochaperone HypA [Steroidobacteraceae bacterium]